METTPKPSPAELSVHRQWCVENNHPGITHNPHMDKTWCACGEKTTQGDTTSDVMCCWREYDSKADAHVWRGSCRAKELA